MEYECFSAMRAFHLPDLAFVQAEPIVVANLDVAAAIGALQVI
jgi:hypothetical protein